MELIRGLRCRGFGESLVKRRLEDMAAINLRQRRILKWRNSLGERETR